MLQSDWVIPVADDIFLTAKEGQVYVVLREQRPKPNLNKHGSRTLGILLTPASARTTADQLRELADWIENTTKSGGRSD